MLTPTTFCLQFTTSSGGVANAYFRAPYACKITDLLVTCQADPGDGDVISVLDGSAHSIGTCTFGSDLAAGDAAGAYAPGATYGDTQFDEGDLIQLQITQCAAAVVLHCILTLDPFCRTVSI